MSSEISKTELCKQRDQKILEKTKESQRRAFKRRKESNSNHIRELDRQAFAKSKKSNPQHVREVNRNAQDRSLMSGLNPTDHDLLQQATKRASCTPVNEIQEIECKNSKQEMQKVAKVIEAFHDNIKNLYVLAVIKYGICHLSGSVKQTNILNVLKRCLKHV